MSTVRSRWFCLTLTVAEADLGTAAGIFVANGIPSLEERPDPRGTKLVGYSDSELQLRRVAAQAKELLGKPPRFCEVQLGPYDDDSWKIAWIQHLEPQLLGTGFVLVPTHAETPRLDGRRAIRYEPEMAFGDGGHATTRLAAAAVERACQERPGCRVLDVGAGNGVLSFVAHFLGAREVIGLEIDPLALEAGRRNAGLNGVPPDMCRFSSEPLDSLEAPFDVVVANIEIRPLLGLIPGMQRLLASDGEWILTGFLRDAARQVQDALGRAGAEVLGRRERDDWVLLVAGHRPSRVD